MKSRTEILLCCLLPLAACSSASGGTQPDTSQEHPSQGAVGDAIIAAICTNETVPPCGDAGANYAPKTTTECETANAFDGGDGKRALEGNFKGGFDEGTAGIHTGIPTPTAYWIKVHVVYIEPGFYAGIVAKPAEMRITVHITDPSGTVVLDDFVLSDMAGGFSSGERLRTMGAHMGSETADYLRKRIGLKK